MVPFQPYPPPGTASDTSQMMIAAAREPTDPGASGDNPHPKPEPMSHAIRPDQERAGISSITESFQIFLAESEVMPNFVEQSNANLLNHRFV